VDFLLSQLSARFDLSTARGKSDAVRDTLPIIRDLADPVERAHYEQALADAVGVDRSALAFAPIRPRSMQPVQNGPVLPRRGPDLEEFLLALGVVGANEGSGAVEVRLRPEADALRRLIQTRLAEGIEPSQLFDGMDETELAAIAERVQREVAQLTNVDSTHLIQERKIADLELTRHRLYREFAEIRVALSDSDDDDAAHGVSWAPALKQVAEQINDVERQLQSIGRVGSMSWESRKAREVMGG
jgi:DNA primase